MAKNLKLHIKNAQLAEALKLNKIAQTPSKSQEEPVPATVQVLEPVAPPLLPSVPEKSHELPSLSLEQDTQSVHSETRTEAVVEIERESPPPPQHVAPPIKTVRGELRPAVKSDNSLHRPLSHQAPATPRPRSSSVPHTTSTLGNASRNVTKPETSTLRSLPPHTTDQKKAGVKELKDFKQAKKGMVELVRQFDSRDRQGLRDLEGSGWKKKRPAVKQKSCIIDEVIRPKHLSVRLPISVKDLAVAMKLKASQLIARLFMRGITATINDYLDDETTVQLLGHDFECDIAIDTAEDKRIRITDKTIQEEILATSRDTVTLRPPVIAFMGHVDHGKTSLIDAIRRSNRVAGEAGAITQHIGAFQCTTSVGTITVLDTPGHEAFAAMRARGAVVTDIVVIVVAGDEGLKTQTLEAIEQARAAHVAMIIAINKSDKPGFHPDNVYRQLAEHNLLPEAWGGTTITVHCSAVTKNGIQDLLDMLALQAEILELRADPTARARGSVIESEMHKGLGAQATVLVQNGTLHIGDALVFDQHWGRVKTMQDEFGQDIVHATPAMPVKISGLSGLPGAGSEFIVVKDEREARELGEARTLGHRSLLLQQTKKAGVENLLQQKAESAGKKVLTLILRTDVQGSLEALQNSLKRIPSTKVEVNIISSMVGEISESDIELAAASKATIIGFHTNIEGHAEPLIKERKVLVRVYDVIYHAVDEVHALMKNRLDKIPQETDSGVAEVKAVFKASQWGVIAGCQVVSGTIKRNQSIRLMRNGERIWTGSIASLKRVKEDVREVNKGFECGILLHNYEGVKIGDVLESFDITYLEQDL